MATAEFMKKWGLFAVVMFLIILIGYLFFYDSVQREVKDKSRCIREKQAATTGGIHTVYAKDSNNQNAYKVTYNTTPNKKSVSIECSCAPGETINKFTGIQYYDYSQNRTVTTGEKICGCSSTIGTAGGSMLYSGSPYLVSYMTSGDTTFFTK